MIKTVAVECGNEHNMTSLAFYCYEGNLKAAESGFKSNVMYLYLTQGQSFCWVCLFGQSTLLLIQTID